jgi:hypothetical protein
MTEDHFRLLTSNTWLYTRFIYALEETLNTIWGVDFLVNSQKYKNTFIWFTKSFWDHIVDVKYIKGTLLKNKYMATIHPTPAPTSELAPTSLNNLERWLSTDTRDVESTDFEKHTNYRVGVIACWDRVITPPRYLSYLSILHKMLRFFLLWYAATHFEIFTFYQPFFRLSTTLIGLDAISCSTWYIQTTAYLLATAIL